MGGGIRRLWRPMDQQLRRRHAAKFTPSQLQSSGSPTPAIIISNDGSSDLAGVTGIGIDSDGDLWATSFNDVVEEFSHGQLATSGSPTPADTISGSATQLDICVNLVIEEAPVISSIAPATGSALGSTTVTIDGGGFTPSTEIDFGTVPATSVSYVSPFEVKAVSPPGSGSVNVTATTFAGSSATSPADLFTYAPLPQIGYWEAASDGGVFAYGDAGFYGSHGGSPLNRPVVGMASTPDGKGYWLVASDGGVFAYGDAGFYGSHGGSPLNRPVVGMASAPDGKGYWLVASDGGVFAYGDAGFYGSHGGSPLNRPVVGMASAPDGKGYWLVASDGGVFAYGDAGFYGSHGGSPLSRPVVGMASTPDGKGYWLVASDGGVFAYGDAGFYGSHGGSPLNRPVVGMASTPDGKGYWLVASDGGVFAYGDAGFYGSHGGSPLNRPVVGLTAARPVG